MLAEQPGATAGRMRRCVSSRAPGPAQYMIRFVVGPDGALVPDLAARLPGRGLWVGADRTTLGRAIARGQFAKAARARVTADPALVEQVGAMLVRRCLDLIGLARRAGQVTAGFDQVSDYLRHHQAALVLTARDGAGEGRRRIEALAGTTPVLAPLDRAELGAALGRDEAVHLALAEGGLAGQLSQELERLRGFREFSMPLRHAAGSNAVAEGASRT
ncbi:MAG: RNA-binding protein [Geminicoccaceae bacterium]